MLEFLQQAQATYAQLGSRAKTLLAARLEEPGAGDSDDEEEEEEEDWTRCPTQRRVILELPEGTVPN